MATVKFRGVEMHNVQDIHTEGGRIVVGDTAFPCVEGVTIHFIEGFANTVSCKSATLVAKPQNVVVEPKASIYSVRDDIDKPEMIHIKKEQKPPVVLTNGYHPAYYHTNENPEEVDYQQEVVPQGELSNFAPKIIPVRYLEDAEVMEIVGSVEVIQAPDCEIIGYVTILSLTVSERLICLGEIDRVEGNVINVPLRRVANDTSFFKPVSRGFELACNSDYKSFQYPNAKLPEYATKHSAAADFFCAEDVTIPPAEIGGGKVIVKPTLVHTGIKAYMNNNEVLHLYNRSGNAKRGLVLANSVGVVDSDYYNNETNDGEIMFAFYNFSGKTIEIKAGERIGQGEFIEYLRGFGATVRDDERIGGFGSTGV